MRTKTNVANKSFRKLFVLDVSRSKVSGEGLLAPPTTALLVGAVDAIGEAVAALVKRNTRAVTTRKLGGRIAAIATWWSYEATRSAASEAATISCGGNGGDTQGTPRELTQEKSG